MIVKLNLIASCQKELTNYLLMMAKGARKFHLPSLASQHLRKLDSTGLPLVFDKIQQEVKLRLAEGQNADLLYGLDLLDRTDIQSFDKKDKAFFFCYKAVFFSHLNSGDDATKNFGYATQIQDNLHKVWSVYGDFLENVYSRYPATKREMASHTTGVFAMQALMEAVSVVGSNERKCREDFAKCLWLLSLDDGDFSSPSGGGQQRLAKVFQERLHRIHPDVILTWLQSMCTSLLRPEGGHIALALKHIVQEYPSLLYSLLKPMQHQLSSELLLEMKTSNKKRVTQLINALHSIMEDEPIDMGEDNCVEEPVDPLFPGSTCTTMREPLLTAEAISGSLKRRRGGGKKQVLVVMRGNESEAKKTKKSQDHDPSSDEDLSQAAESDMETETEEREKKETLSSDDEYFVHVGQSGSELMETSSTGKKKAGVKTTKRKMSSSKTMRCSSEDMTAVEQSVGLSTCYALHRCYALIQQLQLKNAQKLHVYDRFCENVAGRLAPSWSEQLLSYLDQFSQHINHLLISVASLSQSNVEGDFSQLKMPHWLLEQLTAILASFGLSVEEDYDQLVESIPSLMEEANRPVLKMLLPQFRRVTAVARASVLQEMDEKETAYRQELQLQFQEQFQEKLQDAPLLQVLEHIVTEWRPILLEHVEKSVPRKLFLSQRGVTCLSELVSLTSASSSGLTCQLTQPLESMLDLPGEWGNFADCNPSTAPVTSLTNKNLTVADILPVSTCGQSEPLPGGLGVSSLVSNFSF
ncbi:hypothetical protein Ciccas_002783 [Cichlidogyrus casuarinus]|uniref:PIK-related kinase FAT domain-containing protein n=1 Tax=Cichlidogyrus casuarinus TaxID=1844966 RepID=A0ABD2QH76_9PLAT